MKLNEIQDNESRNKGGQQSLDDKDKNCSVMMRSECCIKEITNVNRSNRLHFTLHIYKKVKLKVYKPLLLLKFALFFWFAGSFGAQTFLYVFLKQRGFSVAHVSFATVAGVVFQLLGSSLSGVIADKIGRAKPVIFTHMAISVIVSFSFMVIPPIASDSTIHQFWLHNSKLHNNSTLIAEAWCNNSGTFVQQNTCNFFYTTNGSYFYNKEFCNPVCGDTDDMFFVSFDLNDTTFENTELCHHENKEATFSGTLLLAFCNSSHCKFLEKECMAQIENCQNSGRNRTLLLSVYVLLIGLHHMARSSIFRFYDLTVLSLITEHDADFGKQRVFSILGSLIGPSLIGYIMQVISPGNDKNYSLAFAFYGLFTILSGLSNWNVNIRVKDPGQRMWRKALVLLKKPDILVFVLILVVMGTAYNFMSIFVGWYLEDLGASKMLIGLHFPLSNVFSLFFLSTSKWWVRKFGEHNIFILGLLSHAVFGISYSFLKEPWVAFVIGSLTFIFFYHLFWVAVMHYSHSIAPEGLYATVVVTAGVLHYIASRVTAILIGGLIMDVYGGRIAFRVMGSMCFVTAVLYGSYHYSKDLYLKKNIDSI